jgi:ATP phosphoribosyltransferase
VSRAVAPRAVIDDGSTTSSAAVGRDSLPPRTGRLRFAIPNKGRLAEPAIELLRDAGFSFDPHDRRLIAHVDNLPIDILFVRADDIVEFVEDGVADVGITGLDLLAESESALERLRPLGFGQCTLAVAVPDESAYADIRDLRGLRVATSHPTVTRRHFARLEVSVQIIPLSGAVEVAPRLGLAEAIVDLVSTGSTLAMNGLRPIADVIDSEAVLVAGHAVSPRSEEIAGIDLMLGAVLEARRSKYVMMNAPASRLGDLRALLPALASPSVIPLAEDGMIAIHSVVGAEEVWRLLPELRAAGASGILVLPIEKMLS